MRYITSSALRESITLRNLLLRLFEMTFKTFLIIFYIATASTGIVPSFRVDYNTLFTEARIKPLKYSVYSQSAPEQYIKVSGYHQHAKPISAAHQLTNSDYTYHSHPQHQYGYNIEDSITGDSKSQVETREGDQVRGEYSLADADGFRRIVKYTADSVNGFSAVVSREPFNNAINVVAATSAIVRAGPTRIPYVSESAQVHVSDPVVKHAYAVTPIVKANPVAYPI